jgi:hypothetical protein
MDHPTDHLQSHKQRLVEMLLAIKDEALLMQIEHMIRDAGITASDELLTPSDLELRFQSARVQVAEGRYKSAQELLDEVKGWG